MEGVDATIEVRGGGIMGQAEAVTDRLAGDPGAEEARGCLPPGDPRALTAKIMIVQWNTMVDYNSNGYMGYGELYWDADVKGGPAP
jgi:hypothetical protein